ncbi:hypothetical protein QZH41_016682 [Actinostola sp. cb2023]|nr:hypothetical protein QZH41_016682 [Actinostola sp. cb2023]
MAANSDKMDVEEVGGFSTAEWLVERAKQSLKQNNIFEAKSWLLTAKTLYPKDFHVQHEAYNIERNTKKVKESAHLFYEMFVEFPGESLLWEDIQNLTVALEGSELDSKGELLKGRCKDCIEKCRMLLLLMRRFPDSVPKNGITLTEMLIDAENTEYHSNPLNPYRKLLGTSCLMPSTPLVLIEDMSADKNINNDGWAGGSPSEGSSSAPKKKKKKGATAPLSPSREDQRAKQTATVVVSKNCGSISSSLSDDFVVSVDTWHILNTHSDYRNEFTRVLSEWHIDQWMWMESFKVDRMVYKAKYKKVVDFLKEQKSFLEADPSPAHQEITIRGSLQLSCCYYYLGEYRSSCAEALDALRMFSSQNPSDAKMLKRGLSTIHSSTSRDITALSQLNTQGRILQLIPCTEAEALSYCVRLLITCFKQKISHEGRSGDFVGHMIVLLQCDWPKEERTFFELLDRIRSHGGLTYRKFFDYIISIDILEEFSYLNSEGVLKLELLPKSSASSRTRTVTRGVNKGAKEDFKSAIEKQVLRCEENVDVILRMFLEEERNSIINIV